MSDPRIFLNAGAKLYRDAAKRPRNPVARLNLARTLVHEQIHNTEWDDDEGEYAAKRKEADWYREQLTRARLSHRDSQAAQEELKVLETRAQAAEKNARRTRDREALARELEKEPETSAVSPPHRARHDVTELQERTAGTLGFPLSWSILNLSRAN